eukprot:426519_1
MPTFPTKKANFLYYYDRNIDILKAKEIDEPLSASCCRFFKVTLFICTLSWIPLILIALLEYFYFYQHSTYNKYDFGYLSNILFFIICSIGNSLLTLSLQKQYENAINCKRYGNLLHSIVTNKIPYKRLMWCIIYNILIAVIGAILLLIFKPKLSSDVIVITNVNVCKTFLHCTSYTWYRFLTESIFPGFYLPVTLFIMYSLFIREIFSSITDDDDMGNLQMILLVAPEITDEEPSMSNRSDSIIVSDVIDDGKSNTKHIIWCCIFLICNCFLMIWLNIEYALNFSYSPSENKFEIFYWQFICGITIFKFIMKRIGRKVDRIKSIRDDYNHYVSIEYLMEWFFSCIYWHWMRTFCVFNDLNIYHFIQIIGLHFLLEIIETNIKFTKFYFDITKQWTLSWQDEDGLKRKLYDDCIIKEWRIRLSMDIMARFYCGFIVGILELIHAAFIGRKGIETYYDSRYGNTKQQYKNTLIYLCIASVLEIIHYLFTFIIVNKIYRFNILTTFLNYVLSMQKLQILFSMLMLIYFVWIY